MGNPVFVNQFAQSSCIKKKHCFKYCVSNILFESIQFITHFISDQTQTKNKTQWNSKQKKRKNNKVMGSNFYTCPIFAHC